MNCLDCALLTGHGEPVGTCIDCGAAVCATHAVVRPVAVTRGRTALLQRQVSAPARSIRCRLCDQVRHSAPATDARSTPPSSAEASSA